MADQTKKSLTTSAMVDLKAELHRKQEEFKRQRGGDEKFVKGRKLEKIKSNKSIWNQQNRGVVARASKDIEATKEEEDELLKSRRMLAHKSRLYEEMSSTNNVPDDDGCEGFLVDFQRKAVDQIVEERDKLGQAEDEKKEEEAEMKALAEPVPEPVDSDEEWIDFTDSLGRSRRCMKKDLQRMKEKDLRLTGEAAEQKEDIGRPGPKLPDLMSSDMHREKMRQKWEEEAQILLDKDQKDIHYSNVQFDEIRTHGVGFYQFSKDHESREEQLDQLKKLRDETVNETSRNDRIKAKRKAMMEARLAKVRDRRKLKEVMPDTREEDIAKKEADLAAKKAEEEEMKKREEAKKEAAEVRKNHLREWDKDKQTNSWVGRGYVDTKRNEREAEFAPPSFYLGNSKASNEKRASVSNDEIRMNRLKQSTRTMAVNPDFAPPSSYYFTLGRRSGPHHEKKPWPPSKSPSPSTTMKIMPQESGDLDMKMKHEIENKPFDSGGNDVCLESIPLPGVEHSKGNDMVRASSADIYFGDDRKEEKVAFEDYQTPCQEGDSHTGYSHPTGNTGNEYYQYFNQQYPSYHQHNQVDIQHFQSQLWQSDQRNYSQQLLAFSQQPLHSNLQSTWQMPQQLPPLGQCDHNQQQQLIQQQQVEQHQQQQQQQQQPHSSKRSISDQCQEKSIPAKAKVPKTAIMDMRFMLNEETTATSDKDPSLSSNAVEAVPYEPGSFTATRFPQEVNPDDDFVVTLNKTAQFSGGPKLYTREQQEGQQKQLEQRENEGTTDKDIIEVDKKLQDFLAFVRAETS